MIGKIAVQLALNNGCQWDDALAKSQDYLADAGKILAAIVEVAEREMPKAKIIASGLYGEGFRNGVDAQRQACIDWLKEE